MSDYAVVNPATGETLATYPAITDDALESAIATADAAYRTWRDTPIAERAAKPGRSALQLAGEMCAIDQGMLPYFVTAAQSCHSRRLPGGWGVMTAIRTAPDVRNWHLADV